MLKWIKMSFSLAVVSAAALGLTLRIPILLGADGSAEAQQTKERSSKAPTLKELLEPIHQKYKLPALAAAIVRDGKLIAEEAIGVRRAMHQEPVTIKDCFHIGSCTKSMTATLCAILVEQGKLRWDTTVAEAFPHLKEKIHPDWHGVTLDQLLSHRSGLPEDREPDPVLWPKILALKGPLDKQRLALVELVLEHKPKTLPGTKFQYSNDGYTIAGAMCEGAVGKTWEVLMREMLLMPLGMTTAGFGPPGEAKTVDQPWGHEVVRGSLKPLPPKRDADNPPVIGPAGTVHCSIGDWARYAAFHLGAAPRLLKAETLRRLHSPRPGEDYAYGWLVRERDWAGGRTLSHAGSNGFWFADIWLAPSRQSAYLAATNRGDDEASEGCDAVIAKLIDWKPAEASERKSK